MEKDLKDRPILLFTNFWDAEDLIHCENFVFKNPHGSDDDIAILTFNRTPSHSNYSVLSIALSMPKCFKEPFRDSPDPLGKIKRLDFLCPTYDILSDYKTDKDWEKYRSRFFVLLKKRKPEIKGWLESLFPGHIYMLCCWEDTSTGAHCHRDILYNAFKKSSWSRDRLFLFSRHGVKPRRERISSMEDRRVPHAMVEATSPLDAADEFLYGTESFPSSTYGSSLSGITFTADSYNSVNLSLNLASREGDTAVVRHYDRYQQNRPEEISSALNIMDDIAKPAKPDEPDEPDEPDDEDFDRLDDILGEPE